MTLKTKIALILTIFFWASAFVAIRAGLQHYSPEGLALLRFIVASICMIGIYFNLPNRTHISLADKLIMLVIGALGIGIYNLTLNYGELAVTSGAASFIISQSPLITTIFALLFLGERLTLFRILGFIVSVIGVVLIAFSQKTAAKWDIGMMYICIATVIGGFFSVMQKPFLKKYHAIQVTAFLIWGAALFLLIYLPKLQGDLMTASFSSTLTVVYLGVFPAAMGYLGWSYILTEIPAARAVSFLYFMPFIATMIGWFWLKEIPVMLSVGGGLLAIFGVWLINRSYQQTIAVES